MVHRPDPTDLNPLKFTLFGETVDGKPYRTGFWTRDFSGGTPPDLTAATAFVSAIKRVVHPQIVFLGWGWRLKSGTLYLDTAFATPIIGTHPTSGAILSNSATLSYGGVAIDLTGVTRNIRCISHVPRGNIFAGSNGTIRIDRDDTDVAAFLDYLPTVHPTDNFGRQLHLYPYMDTQCNAFYQGRSGF